MIAVAFVACLLVAVCLTLIAIGLRAPITDDLPLIEVLDESETS